MGRADPGLVDNLSRVFAAAPAIKAAWLALARWTTGEEGFLLDIRVVPGETAIRC